MSKGEEMKVDINIKEYLFILKKRLWILVLFIAGGTVLASLYSSTNYRPVYLASTKLIVNKTVTEEQLGRQEIDYGAIGVNIGLISTYKEIIKTPAIMDKVVQRYPDLNLTSEQLIGMINVSSLNDTQIMTIAAQYYSYDKAATIVNAVSEVFRTEIPKIMKVDNVTILNPAKSKEHPVPINKKSNQIILLGFVGSFVAAVGLILFLEAMDDTLKTDEDVRTIFRQPALAVIPRMKAKERRPASRVQSREKAGETTYAATIR
ncbi:Wzz/FepE/Etk N-terminal domain-containing protein [Paenibacillus aurantius]|uniref:Wzz/FepE/Etk N-terminal domain-containing protein n=1 Tax=Paenibacillus aurantius TaxID=2918900 RepID=A0AA96LG44_9BACL|nr:Wzz/FepE/Etk N-terminal domain-containing protein [Paenibacillus aurantius]WNQ12668.1 Wzz/FepE/Etk N-terminal domain-containing protein [Paenibacillus aurantius]